MNSSKSLVRRPRVRHSPSEWRDIIDQYEQSDQTQEIFCAEQSLALSTFSRWRQRLADASDLIPGQEAHFVELSSHEDSAAVPSPGLWDVELQLGADLFLRLRRC